MKRGIRQGKQTNKQKEVGRQHQGMDRPGVHGVQEGSEEQRKLKENGCAVICGAPQNQQSGESEKNLLNCFG